MEQFDLVDENDNVIGITDKPTAHANKQLHRVVAVYVFNESSELYVQVHQSSGGLYDHSAGGHVIKGEDYADAAHREAQEELGISQTLKELKRSFHSGNSKLGHMFGIFECQVDKTWSFVPNDEVKDIVLMKLDEIQNLMRTKPEKFTHGFLNTMAEYRKIKGLQ